MQWNQWTENQELISWIEEMAVLCRPQSVHMCDGSEQEYADMCQLLVDKGMFVPLNASRPNSFWCRTHPDDVARVEEATFICSKKREDAGPTNNWRAPDEMHALLHKRFNGCMAGRVMYIVPYCMGPLGSKSSHIGIEITDSPYVVVNMKLMTRMGKEALKWLGNGPFVPGMHSVGVPLKEGQQDVFWPCNPKERCIVHFPEERSIWSFGSGYGGNVLLGKKCFALRIASVMARDQMWMAEHMLILGITNPEGKKKYFAAAFPSACGKTNLAMLQSTLPGWKIECVGDDIAWMRIKEDGRLFAINPEAGFFGVAPGTSYEVNPSAMQTLEKNAIFTNVALTADKDVWWEGMSKTPPEGLTDWQGHSWIPGSGKPASYPNARFTVAASQCPVIDPAWEDPEGVPISAILFGGRRATTIPLVTEAFSWQHGTFLGACISSEMTAAAKGEVGKLRHDPFAMLPFCGYHMGDYFAHWLEMGKQSAPHLLPRLFTVNWFRKDAEGAFLWPGFGENIRVLKWIFERVDEKVSGIKTAIGYVPDVHTLDLQGLSLSPKDIEPLVKIDREAFIKEVEEMRSYFTIFGNNLPEALREELDALQLRLERA